MTGSRLPAPWQNEANVLACTLRAGGIPAFVADWHFISVKPSLEFGSNRPRVLIPPACRDAALAWLDSLPEVETTPLYPCPDCGGETRRVRRILVMLIVTWLGTFHPFFSPRRRCGACRKTFRPAPPEPFTEAELGYAPDPSLGTRKWLREMRTAGLAPVSDPAEPPALDADRRAGLGKSDQ